MNALRPSTLHWPHLHVPHPHVPHLTHPHPVLRMWAMATLLAAALTLLVLAVLVTQSVAPEPRWLRP